MCWIWSRGELTSESSCGCLSGEITSYPTDNVSHAQTNKQTNKQRNKQTNEQTKQSKAKQSKIVGLGGFLFVSSLKGFLLCFSYRPVKLSSFLARRSGPVLFLPHSLLFIRVDIFSNFVFPFGRVFQRAVRRRSRLFLFLVSSENGGTVFFSYVDGDKSVEMRTNF